MGPLQGKTIVLGVSGGIAAYKAAEVVRLMTGRGAAVRVMMTPNAAQFITALTLQTLSGHPVANDTFSLTQESEISHIRLADNADAIVIAPATADIIGKAAAGIADDLVTTVLLAARCPVAFAPAMNVHMYGHPAVVENMAKLRGRGVTIIDPSEGELACGYEGKGRLAEPEAVVEEVERMVSRHDLGGQRVLVTAGPTVEPMDPVRVISNRSSGRMGFAVARAAWRRGAEVKLIAGPTALATPRGVERIDVEDAARMLDEISSRFPWCTALVMAAAVADFRPVRVAAQKMKKSARIITLELAPIADELPRLTARKAGRVVIGFAAETENLEANAKSKLREKKLDLIVANDVTSAGAGFGVDTNVVTLIGANGFVQSYPKMAKDEVADVILDRLVALLATGAKGRRLRAVK